MSITIGDVLKMEEWKDCEIIAGEAGLSREVLYIDSMEVPDIIPWLKKDELLITTGYAINKSEETLLNIIRAMNDNQSAGIALKTKFFGEITEKIRKTADDLKVPIIVIPSDMPFIDLANPLMKRVVDEQNQKLEFSRAMNEKFLAVQIEGGSFQEISQILGELLHCQVIVTDNRKNCVCCFPEDLRYRDRWFTEDGYGRKFSCPSPQNFVMIDREGLSVSTTEDAEIWRLAIYVKSRCNGYLYVVGERGQFGELSEVACIQASVHLALEFSKKGLREQKEYYQDNNFFLDLINNNVLSEEDAERRARGLHWPNFPYQLVVADVDGFEEIIRDKDEDEIQNIKDNIMQIHKEVLGQKGHCFFIGNKSDSFHCLFTKQADRQVIEADMREVQRQIDRTLKMSVTVGVSRKVNHFAELSDAYQEARTAISIGKKKETFKICFIDELQMEEAFFEMAKMEIFQKFVRDSLQVLEEYDKKHGSYLLETLKVLTENLGARKETADILYLHRNTLTYRIRQIEQLTDCDLGDPQVLFRLYLAIKVRTYMGD